MNELGAAEFMFEVEERTVDLKELPLQQTLGQRSDSDPGHKVILRPDTGEIIAVVRKSYRLIPNEDLIMQFYTELRDRQIPAFLDYSHSFVTNRQMRLQITIPELTFEDGDSEITLCIFLHNSYDGSEKVRIVFGATRIICTNGMVLTESLTEYSFKHQAGVNIEAIVSRAISSVFDEWPIVEDKVKLLAMTPFEVETYERVEKLMGKDWVTYLRSRKPETMWGAYNELTGYISGQLLKEDRAIHQRRVSAVFNL